MKIDWFAVVFTLLIIIGVILGLRVVIRDTHHAFDVENKKHQIYLQKCSPFYFVSTTLAAEGLMKVSCLNEQGEKKEVFIKTSELDEIK